jgi:hypothetical protein
MLDLFLKGRAGRKSPFRGSARLGMSRYRVMASAMVGGVSKRPRLCTGVVGVTECCPRLPEGGGSPRPDSRVLARRWSFDVRHDPSGIGGGRGPACFGEKPGVSFGVSSAIPSVDSSVRKVRLAR